MAVKGSDPASGWSKIASELNSWSKAGIRIPWRDLLYISNGILSWSTWLQLFNAQSTILHDRFLGLTGMFSINTRHAVIQCLTGTILMFSLLAFSVVYTWLVYLLSVPVGPVLFYKIKLLVVDRFLISYERFSNHIMCSWGCQWDFLRTQSAPVCQWIVFDLMFG